MKKVRDKRVLFLLTEEMKSKNRSSVDMILNRINKKTFDTKGKKIGEKIRDLKKDFFDEKNLDLNF